MCTYFESIDLTLSVTLSYSLFSPYFTFNLYIQYARFIRNRSTILGNMNGTKKCPLVCLTIRRLFISTYLYSSRLEVFKTLQICVFRIIRCIAIFVWHLSDYLSYFSKYLSGSRQTRHIVHGTFFVDNNILYMVFRLSPGISLVYLKFDTSIS